MPAGSDRSHVVMYSRKDEVDQLVENFEPEEVGSRLGSIVLFEDWRREKKNSILMCSRTPSEPLVKFSSRSQRDKV